MILHEAAATLKHWTWPLHLTRGQRLVSRQQIVQLEVSGDVLGLLPQPEPLALHHHRQHGDGVFEAGHGDEPSVGVHLLHEGPGGRGEHLAAAARLLEGPRSNVSSAKRCEAPEAELKQTPRSLYEKDKSTLWGWCQFWRLTDKTKQSVNTRVVLMTH